MSHETAQQRARRHKRDPYRASQIAPSWTVPPVRCDQCPHAELMHRRESDGRCLSVGCGCTAYKEAEPCR